MNVSGVSASVSAAPRRAHVIVCGNAKGGTGKSTFAMHIAVALLRTGNRVATIDLDTAQQTLTRYVENRRRWAQGTGIAVAVPDHRDVPHRGKFADSEGETFAALAEALAGVDAAFDFVVIDTAAGDTFAGMLAHRLADTLVTPLNDSLIDLEALGDLPPAGRGSPSGSGYAQAVAQARDERRRADGRLIDWIVACNRVPVTAAGEAKIAPRLRDMASTLGFRFADGISQRSLFDDLFAAGLTAFDEYDGRSASSRPNLAHLAARQEMRRLMDRMDLLHTGPSLPVGGPGTSPTEAAITPAL
ncbi:division plane positioning ATPase MipZ [Neoaquamicrobium sediminum]|uniref:Division plane positioning ATPase MipZ n=1 Tax=Neoaquamicrobium sediminum TaxID=1849104 RepID=A0ABV3WTG0_9HYPH